MLKEADIKNKSKIVELQMSNAKNNVVDVENDFLETLNTELKNGNR
jgi:molybdopterin converting factor small subunit